MKLLITGSNGLLGQKIVLALRKDKSIQTIATSLGENRMKVQDGYIYEPLDVTNESQIISIVEKYLPDAIINTAAMTNVDACENAKEECWAQNVLAVQYFTNALTKLKNQTTGKDIHFIHLSTDFVFDGEDGPYTEEAETNPLSYYAQSKNESEKIVKASELNWTIIRTSIVYGIAHKMSRSNIVLWAKEVLSKATPINVVDDQFRSPTLAEDLAQGCILAAAKQKTGIYNISGKDIMSILDLVLSVAEFWNLDKSLVTPIKTSSLDQAAKRPPKTGFILDKAIKDLGYAPHSFMEGLAILDGQLKTEI